MNVVVTRHAIDRFKQRTAEVMYDSSIVRLLRGVVLLACSPKSGGRWRIKNRRLVIAGRTIGTKAVVLTCWRRKGL